LNRPDLTRDRFVPDDFSNQPGLRLYRTGDLARWHADGTLECLGRLDHQVKLRGHRVELGEIEAVLRELPGIRQAVVVLQEEQLTAYCVGEPGQALAAAACREALRTRLPAYMVPSLYVALASLPLTPNGKIDRRALPAPRIGEDTDVSSRAGPRTAVERELVGLWEEVLRKPVGIHDNFFDLGGHSLLAVQLQSRVRARLGLELEIRQLFATPTLAELAGHLEAMAWAAAGRKDPAPTGGQEVGTL
jgi:aryl carrier-like protein